MPRASRSSNSSIPTATSMSCKVLQAHDAQFPIESLAKLGEQMKQLPKGWQYRTRALTEDLVLDLGPDKTIYAVGDEFHQYYTRIAETK
jgi:hypothetical protein